MSIDLFKFVLAFLESKIIRNCFAELLICYGSNSSSTYVFIKDYSGTMLSVFRSLNLYDIKTILGAVDTLKVLSPDSLKMYRIF